MTGELPHGRDARECICRASMRPRSNDRGIKKIGATRPVDLGASMRPRSNDRGISMVHKSFIFNDLEPPFRVPAAQGRDSCRSPVATHL